MKTILITGAGTGFGNEVAFRLAAKGFDVIAAVEIYPQIEVLENQVKERGVSLRIEKLDVTSEGDRRLSILPLSKDPQPDEAEFNAFFPSKFALSQFTSPKSDLEDADYSQPYKGTRRILLIGVDERYLKMENGTLFSTGNHRSRHWCRCTICTKRASSSTSPLYLAIR